MLLSTKGRYAVMAMVEIAKQGDAKPLFAWRCRRAP